MEGGRELRDDRSSRYGPQWPRLMGLISALHKPSLPRRGKSRAQLQAHGWRKELVGRDRSTLDTRRIPKPEPLQHVCAAALSLLKSELIN